MHFATIHFSVRAIRCNSIGKWNGQHQPEKQATPGSVIRRHVVCLCANEQGAGRFREGKSPNRVTALAPKCDCSPQHCSTLYLGVSRAFALSQMLADPVTIEFRLGDWVPNPVRKPPNVLTEIAVTLLE
jgi:hypothetical protein